MAANVNVYGWHSVLHLLRQRPEHVLAISLQQGREDSRTDELLALAEVTGVHLELLPKTALDKLSHAANHQGVMAIVRERPELNDRDLDDLLDASSNILLLVLDGVQDPHNLGACLRSADGAGATAVIAPKRRAVGLTETVRKVACGAAETIPFVRVTNLARCLRGLGERGVWRIGTSDAADGLLYDQQLSGDLALVMGGEASGLRRLSAENCDALAALPMLGAQESLNVSVATGVCLYEARRQRLALQRNGQ